MELRYALEIDGWMDPSELQWLAEQALTHQRIVEVGCYLGRTTRVLADNTSGWVLAFDDFSGPRDVIIDKHERKQIASRFQANLSCYLASGKVRMLSGDHADESIIPSDLEPDMVFIDGGHEYADVKRDLAIWKPRLAKGGLICGHDSGHPGVWAAVNEELGWKADEVEQLKRGPNFSIWSMKRV